MIDEGLWKPSCMALSWPDAPHMVTEVPGPKVKR